MSRLLGPPGMAEGELGVLVVPVELQSPGLEAVAIADDAGAAIVLNSRLALRPVLWRRSIAHELCHILFDPRDHQPIVDLLAEGENDAPIPEGQRKNREQRARAFAAELLIPTKALTALYPSTCVGAAAARRRAMEAYERFGAPGSWLPTTFPTRTASAKPTPICSSWSGESSPPRWG